LQGGWGVAILELTAHRHSVRMFFRKCTLCVLAIIWTTGRYRIFLMLW
jgi:hypothetical protein